jgi:hypothetical protein
MEIRIPFYVTVLLVIGLGVTIFFGTGKVIDAIHPQTGKVADTTHETGASTGGDLSTHKVLQQQIMAQTR